MTSKKLFFSLLSLAALAAPAHAEEVVGMAKPWQMGFQPAATPVMARLSWLHDTVLMGMCIAIVALVLLLTGYICIRFRQSRRPVASTTSHNTALEIAWTLIPVLILVGIAIPSWRLHYFMERDPDYQMTLKVTGHQWYWSYEYPDQGNFGYDSYMVKDADLKPGQPRLLTVDNPVVVPVNTVVRVQMTGADVIHSWAVPAFGLKRDAMPGRLNETWFKAEKPGVYYGQCSELCGVGHGFMPIEVHVVPQEQFAAWVAGKQKENGIAPASGNASTSPKTQEAVPQPNVTTGGVPNAGNTETNPQPSRAADAPAKKDAAAKNPGTAAPAATPDTSHTNGAPQ